MRDEPSQPLYRFPCPACQRTLKAPVTWAGMRGICPQCQASVDFPRTSLANGAAKTVADLAHLIAEDGRQLEAYAADGIAMLLAQGTCMEYRMAQEQMGDEPLSVRQWRRLLRSAGLREILRLQLHGEINQRLYGADFADEHDESDPVLPLNSEQIHQITLAWQILVRYQDFVVASFCKTCRKDATGLNCIYQSFPAFVAARGMSEKQQERWEKLCRHLLGFSHTA